MNKSIFLQHSSIRPHSVYFTVNRSQQAYFCTVGGKKKKISLLADVRENGAILVNLNFNIYMHKPDQNGHCKLGP